MPAIITDTRQYSGGTMVGGSLAIGETGNFEDILPYQRIWGDLDHAGLISGGGVEDYDAARHLSLGADIAPAARNRAWRKMIAMLNDDKANLAIVAAEWRQTASMIGSKINAMQDLYYEVFHPRRRLHKKRRGRGGDSLSRSAREIGKQSKKLADAWLEYWFGWKPLAMDIQSGLAFFDKPIKPGYIQGKGAAPVNREIHWPPPSFGNGIRSRGYCVVYMGACATVTNPNLYRASQLGLLNPLVAGTELIKFSFILDWLIDFGTWAESFTDFAGVTLEFPWTSSVFRAKQEMEWNPSSLGFARGDVGSFVRKLGLSQPYPNLDWQSNVGHSVERFATAAALLVQLLAKELK